MKTVKMMCKLMNWLLLFSDPFKIVIVPLSWLCWLTISTSISSSLPYSSAILLYVCVCTKVCWFFQSQVLIYGRRQISQIWPTYSAIGSSHMPKRLLSGARCMFCTNLWAPVLKWKVGGSTNVMHMISSLFTTWTGQHKTWLAGMWQTDEAWTFFIDQKNSSNTGNNAYNTNYTKNFKD